MVVTVVVVAAGAVADVAAVDTVVAVEVGNCQFLSFVQLLLFSTSPSIHYYGRQADFLTANDANALPVGSRRW
jgi:hypothetical protein